MQVKPFRGLRPRSDLASAIPSLPYDVMNAAEARSMAEGNPDSFLHVIRPEIDLDPETDPYDAAIYAKGRENLQAMIDDGRMVRDERPAYYIYRLVMDGRAQTGIVGAAAVDDYLEDRIKKHELTRPQKEDDRVRVNETLLANPGPVFLTYRDTPTTNVLVEGLTAAAPTVRFTADDGIEHSLWVVDEPPARAEIESAFAAIDRTYVADGHHRAAAAARVGRKLGEALRDPSGDEPCNYFLAAHFPASQLTVLDYNRVLKDLNGIDEAVFVERICQAGFTVRSDNVDRRPAGPRQVGMYLAGCWYLLEATPGIVPETDVVGRLDVSILTDRVLRPLLGIDNPRTDPRIDFVGGIRGMDGLERRVDGGSDAVAFALYPTSIDDLMLVADAGRVMPPKSTWFEPKLRSGMVVQLLSGDRL